MSVGKVKKKGRQKLSRPFLLPLVLCLVRDRLRQLAVGVAGIEMADGRRLAPPAAPAYRHAA